MNLEDIKKFTLLLNAPDKASRLDALAWLMEAEKAGLIPPPARQRDVNSHIHTIYSFSPYSPAAAVYHSRRAGLVTTGIMDHDSVGGALEFIEAGRIADMPVTVGAELRADFSGTKLEGRRINNPDQETVAYVAFHGIPHSEIAAVAEFFKPVGEARGRRNRAMTVRINELLAGAGVRIDYDRDVVPLSMQHEGGSVTERHLLYAVSRKLDDQLGMGSALTDFVTQHLGIRLSGKNAEYLADTANPTYAFDLLNVLKGNMVEKFYIPATDESLPIAEVARFADSHGIILAYAYLGDVTESVTGDKKAQKFEDDFIVDVFETLRSLNFRSVTYMPSRNTPEQLMKLRTLCAEYGFFQISGEDINQPRQKFVCEAMRGPEFDNLYDAAWALIGHEWKASGNLDDGMFSESTTHALPDLGLRAAAYKKYAMDRFA
ncbi:MAG: PHP domain-containing protein [Saccharofermentanales bacterium]